MKKIRKREITKGINKVIDSESNLAAILRSLYPNLARLNK